MGKKKLAVSIIMAVVLFLGNGMTAQAAESTGGMNQYIPIEEKGEMNLRLSGTTLNDGDKIVVGDYTIEYNEEITYEEKNTRSTTNTWTRTATYGVFATNEEWYKITQKTNYTFDGTTVKINTESCMLTVNQLKSECDHTVLTNTVYSGSTTAPYYKIEVSMSMPSGWLTICDIATVYANGTTSLQHSEY